MMIFLFFIQALFSAMFVIVHGLFQLVLLSCRLIFRDRLKCLIETLILATDISRQHEILTTFKVSRPNQLEDLLFGLTLHLLSETLRNSRAFNLVWKKHRASEPSNAPTVLRRPNNLHSYRCSILTPTELSRPPSLFLNLRNYLLAVSFELACFPVVVISRLVLALRHRGADLEQKIERADNSQQRSVSKTWKFINFRFRNMLSDDFFSVSHQQ